MRKFFFHVLPCFAIDIVYRMCYYVLPCFRALPCFTMIIIFYNDESCGLSGCSQRIVIHQDFKKIANVEVYARLYVFFYGLYNYNSNDCMNLYIIVILAFTLLK
jgi:hypothetical protein